MSIETTTSYNEPEFKDNLLKKITKTKDMEITDARCKAFTQKGERCSRAAKIGSYCSTHSKNVNEKGEYITKEKKTKRPKNAYIRFKIKYAESDQLLDEPNMKDMAFGEKQSHMSKIWKGLTEEEKAPFKEEAKKEIEEFNKTNPAKAKKEAKRAPNKYIFFKNQFSKKLEEEGNKMDFKELQEEASKVWKSMTPEEKQPFVDMANEAKEKFNASKANKLQRPKKPLNVYTAWMRKWDQTIRSENPDKKFTFKELAELRSAAWKKVKNTDAVEEFKAIVNADKTRFETEKAAFEAAGGDMSYGKKNKKKVDVIHQMPPVELMEEADEVLEDLVEFTTAQKLSKPYTQLIIDPSTKKIYDTGDEDNEEATEYGYAEEVEFDEDGSVITIGNIIVL